MDSILKFGGLVAREIQENDLPFPKAIQKVIADSNLVPEENFHFSILSHLVKMGVKASSADEFSLEQRLQMLKEAYHLEKSDPEESR